MPLDFSVVVPTHGRPRQIAECVAALARLDYDHDRFEVVVVDDGSPEPVAVRELAVGTNLRLRVERQARGGPARARNRGIALARARWVAFTDDDCRPAPEWLSKLEQPLAAGADAVVGRTLNGLPRDPYASASQQLIDRLLSWYNREPGDARFGTSNNLAVVRDTIVAIGGFDERFPGAAGEDRELVHRLRARGHRVVAAPAARVEHRHHLDLSSFIAQHYAYGRAAVIFRRQAGAVPVESARFYRHLVTAGDARTSALLVLAQIANAAGFAAERVACRWR